MKYTLSTELADKEVYLIGCIVSQWGFLESDIFNQTLLSFDESEGLPLAMNNVQFSGVLALWRERVVLQKDDARKEVLQAQYDEIVRLSDYRQAVVHSRWEWHPNAPDEITAVRIHKKNIKSVKFTTDALLDFASRLGEIRYLIRYPGGIQDRAEDVATTGGFISRLGWELLSGRASLDDLTGSTTAPVTDTKAKP